MPDSPFAEVLDENRHHPSKCYTKRRVWGLLSTVSVGIICPAFRHCISLAEMMMPVAKSKEV